MRICSCPPLLEPEACDPRRAATDTSAPTALPAASGSCLELWLPLASSASSSSNIAALPVESLGFPTLVLLRESMLFADSMSAIRAPCSMEILGVAQAR